MDPEDQIERDLIDKDILITLAKERNRLAAERTFSAWLRTGLAGVGGGVVVIKFLTFSHAAHKALANMMGQMLILWGILIFIFALVGYFATYRSLNEKTPSTFFTVGITLIALFLMAFSFIIYMIS